jgi:hypothetical protein
MLPHIQKLKFTMRIFYDKQKDLIKKLADYDSQREKTKEFKLKH